MNASGDAVPSTLRGARVFGVGGRAVTWAEVVADARARGAWSEVEREAAEAPTGAALAADQVKARAADFRYARGLVAGEEMEAWLARWGLTVREWMAYIRRTAGPGEEWTVAVCSGALARFAADLAGRLAVHERMHAADPEASMAAFREAVTTDDALAALVHARALDWTRVDADVLSFAHDDAAREAVACLTHDGLTPTQLAATAQAGLEHRIAHLDAFDPLLRGALLGARPGEVVGPIGEIVLRVRDRRYPSLDDPEVRQLANVTVVARAIQREVDDRVVWHVDP